MGERPPVAGMGASTGPARRTFLPLVMRYKPMRQGLGVHVAYRSAGGGLVVGGLSYAALFALVPTLVPVIAGLFLLIDDPQLRQDAVELLDEAFPAFAGITDTAVEGARDLAAVGGDRGSLGLPVGRQRPLSQPAAGDGALFPGERVSGLLARVAGVLLVLVLIVGVLAAVLMAGVLTLVARVLDTDARHLPPAPHRTRAPGGDRHRDHDVGLRPGQPVARDGFRGLRRGGLVLRGPGLASTALPGTRVRGRAGSLP